MPEIVSPQVKLIAWTQFQAPDDVPWSADADGGQALAEFAGRACYQSWKKPNPATATNAGYIRHIDLPLLRPDAEPIRTCTCRTGTARAIMMMSRSA